MSEKNQGLSEYWDGLERFIERELGAFALMRNIVGSLRGDRVVNKVQQLYGYKEEIFYPILNFEPEATGPDLLQNIQLYEVRRHTQFYSSTVGVRVFPGMKSLGFWYADYDQISFTRPAVEISPDSGSPVGFCGFADIRSSVGDPVEEQNQYVYWLKVAAGIVGVKHGLSAV